MLTWQISGRTAQQIVDSIEQGVREGDLPPGETLPSVRVLAARLSVSPATAAAAYRDLRLRGVVAAHPGRGTAVAPRPALTTPARTVEADPRLRDLSQANPDPALLPDLTAALSRISGEHTLYGAATIDARLAELASDRLRDVFDGHKRDGYALCVTGGALDAIERVLRTRCRTNDEVAVEDPCYGGVLDLLRGMGLRPAGFAVDQDGPVPSDLERLLERSVGTVIITPRGQNPTGAALSAKRADEIRRLLRRYPDVHVLENDYLDEVAGLPYRALSAGRASWTVVRSVSKALGPDLRVALLAGDPRTVGRVQGAQFLGTAWVSHLLQRLVVAVWDDPETPQVLQRAERTYRDRRERLIKDLAARSVVGFGRSGLNVMVPVVEEEPVLRGLAAAGWLVRGGERHRLTAGPFIRITAAILEPDDSVRLATDLAALTTPFGGASVASAP